MLLSLKPKPSRVATEYWHGLTSIENTINCLPEGENPIFSSNFSISLGDINQRTNTVVFVQFHQFLQQIT